MKKIALLLSLISTISFSQDDLKQVKPETAVHLREIPRHNLSLAFGVAQPSGDFSDIARSGLNVGLEYTYYTNKYLGLSAGLRHQYNEFGYLDTDTNPENNISSNNYTTTSISIGPSFSYTRNRFQLDVMLKGGIAFYNNPDNVVSNNELQDAPPTILYQSDAANSKSASAYLEGGLRFNYYFRRSVQLFFSPQYNTTLGNPIGYNFLDENSTSFIPEEVRTVNASNFTLNFGVKIALSPEYTSGEDRYDGDE
ncbi:autotransporter outer membrane beta-barrel domain-containing protein [Nonlabens ulvanivorans]|uniref:autotransporter outer membrane beta-barrel domain-containing protein n=1 Tax=Nonlabens ulvanivorans TaxID=906888 RepID=UPI002942A584|nr:autotransporter outer membrane beta-barrel domain-containing protein [Nonlabens ulvanivorans]WOI23814.1 autotransporter outer membrane beta-barrel domain-containing protein [Nonlabens ulvanivorans]